MRGPGTCAHIQVMTTEITQPADATEPRCWDMYAGLRDGVHGPEYADFFDDPRGVKFSGHDDVHRVRLTEDPDGHLRGWIDTGDTTVAMIEHRQIFEIQFPYGSAAHVELGHGEVVSLRVEAIDGPAATVKDA